MSAADYAPDDILADIERVVRRLDEILITNRVDETITLPARELIDLINSLSKLFLGCEDIKDICTRVGLDEEGILSSIDEAEAIIEDKYEYARDERITLAAAVLHLTEGESSPKSRALAIKLARHVIDSFEKPAIIDEPVDRKYFQDLAENHLLAHPD